MAASGIRLRRLATARGAFLMAPLDHGASMGPIPGIEDVATTIAALAPHASCVTLHKGLVRHAQEYARDLGILLHLSASTDLAPDPTEKRLVATVAEAARMGCDGVSIHINLGSPTEARQLEDAGRVATECQELGMPLITMAYPRGPAIDPSDPRPVAHAARVAAELGADAVKVPYTGSEETFRDVVRGAGIPVIVAGGPRVDEARFLASVQAARRAGAAGVSVGRNVFQAADPAAAMARIADLFA